MTTTSTITPELLDQLLANYKKPEDLTGKDGLFKQLKKALIERALGAELTEHLGYEKGDPAVSVRPRLQDCPLDCPQLRRRSWASPAPRFFQGSSSCSRFTGYKPMRAMTSRR